MDIWQLNIFCKVVELKSFSKAAKVVHLSQPTISSHIKDLETHLKCRLIDRLAKGAAPTKAGKLLYEYASKIIDLRDRAESAISEFQGEIKGSLVIGGSTIPGVYILPKIIGAFSMKYPNVTVRLINGSTEFIVDQIITGNIEIGIVGALSADKHLIQEKLIEDEMRLIVPDGHKWAGRKQLSLKALSGEPFISREPGSGTLKSVQKSFNQQGLIFEHLKIVAEMGSTEAVIQGIKHHIGVSILSPIAVTEEINQGFLYALNITGLDLRRNFYLTFHKYRSPSPLREVFEKFIKTRFNESPGGNQVKFKNIKGSIST
jgi:DNA-binding transcriptional LysR family regulator